MDKVIAISDKIDDLSLIYAYIPLNHFALRELGKKNKTYLVAPRRYWSSFFFAGCFADVVFYDGLLDEYLAGSKVVTDNFLIIDKIDKEVIQQKLQVKTSSLDRFNVYNNKLKLLRAAIHDRATAISSRNKGTHGVIFPGLEEQMQSKLFAHLHNRLYIQPVAPLPPGEPRPQNIPPFGHFEINVTYARLLEIVTHARLCIGLPSAYTYLSIYLNIPTFLVMYDSYLPDKIMTSWGHVQRLYLPERLTTNELLKQVDHSAFFYEYLSD